MRWRTWHTRPSFRDNRQYICVFPQEFLCFDRVYGLQDTLASRPSTTAAQESMANDATSVSGWYLLSHQNEIRTTFDRFAETVHQACIFQLYALILSGMSIH